MINELVPSYTIDLVFSLWHFYEIFDIRTGNLSYDHVTTKPQHLVLFQGMVVYKTSGQLLYPRSYHGERKTFFRKHVSCSLLSLLLINFQSYKAEYLSSAVLLESTFCEYANISLPFP